MTLTNRGFPPWITPPPTVDELVTTDGEPMESNRHRLQMNLLVDTLDIYWADRQDVFVGGNMFLYFSVVQAKKNDFRGPDVFVVQDTVRRDRKAWVVWEEGGKLPDLIVELLSESTAAEDRGRKKRIYGQVLKIPEYILFDPYTGELEAYRLQLPSLEFVPIPRDERGQLVSERLGLRLAVWHGVHRGIEADWLRWLDADGVWLPSPEERAEAALERADAESERADAERRRREAAEAELEELRRRLRDGSG